MADKTISQIVSEGTTIKNNTTKGSNTAAVVGGAIEDVAKYIQDNESTWSASGSGSGSVTVDSALSSSSTNPVQNKVINAALATKANASDLSNYATESYVNQQIANIPGGSGGSTASDGYTTITSLSNLTAGKYRITSSINLGGAKVSIPFGVRIKMDGGVIKNGRLEMNDDPSCVFMDCYRCFEPSLSMYTKVGGTVEFDWWQYYSWTGQDERFGGKYSDFCRDYYQLLDSEYPTTFGSTPATYYDGEKNAIEALQSKYGTSGTKAIPTTNNTIFDNIVKREAGEGSSSGDEQDCGRQLTIKFGRRIYPFQSRIELLAYTQFCRVTGEGKNRTCLLFNDKGFINSNSFQLEISHLCITSARSCISFENPGANALSPGFGIYEDDFFISLRGNSVDCPKYLDNGNVNKIVLNKNTFHDVVVNPGPNKCGFSNVLSTTAIFDVISDHYRCYKDLYDVSDKEQLTEDYTHTNGVTYEKGAGDPRTSAPARPYKALFGFFNVVESESPLVERTFATGQMSHVSWNYGRKSNYFIYCESANCAFNQISLSFSHVENNPREQAYFFWMGDCPESGGQANGTKTQLSLLGNRFNGVYDNYSHPFITAPNLIIKGDLENADDNGTLAPHYINCSTTIENLTTSVLKNIYRSENMDDCMVILPNSYCSNNYYIEHSNPSKNSGKLNLGVGMHKNPYYKVGEDFQRDYLDISYYKINQADQAAITKNASVRNTNFYGMSIPTSNYKGNEKFNICGDIRLSDAGGYEYLPSTGYNPNESYFHHFMTSAFQGIGVDGFTGADFNNRREVSIKNDTKYAFIVSTKASIDASPNYKFVVLPNTIANLSAEDGVRYKLANAGTTNRLSSNIKWYFNCYRGKEFTYIDGTNRYRFQYEVIENSENKNSGLLCANESRQSSTAYGICRFNGPGEFNGSSSKKYYYVSGDYIYLCVEEGTTAATAPDLSSHKGFNDVFEDGTAKFVCLGKNGALKLIDAVCGDTSITVTSGSVSLVGRVITKPTLAVPTCIADGCQWFDTTSKKVYWWNGSNWIDGSGTVKSSS